MLDVESFFSNNKILMKSFLKFINFFQEDNKIFYFLLLIKYIPLIVITHDWKIFHKNGFYSFFGKFTFTGYLTQESNSIIIDIIFFLMTFLNFGVFVCFYIGYRRLREGIFVDKFYKKLFYKSLKFLVILNLFFSQYYYEIIIFIINFYFKIDINGEHITMKYLTLVLGILIFLFVTIFNYIFSFLIFKPYILNNSYFTYELNKSNSNLLVYPLYKIFIVLEFFVAFRQILIIKLIIRILYIINFSKNLFKRNIKTYYIELFISSCCCISSIFELIFIKDFFNITNTTISGSSTSSNADDILTISPLYNNRILLSKLLIEIVISILICLLKSHSEKKGILNIFNNLKSKDFYTSNMQLLDLFLTHRKKEIKIEFISQICKAINLHIEICGNNLDCVCNIYKDALLSGKIIKKETKFKGLNTDATLNLATNGISGKKTLKSSTINPRFKDQLFSKKTLKETLNEAYLNSNQLQKNSIKNLSELNINAFNKNFSLKNPQQNKNLKIPTINNQPNTNYNKENEKDTCTNNFFSNLEIIFLENLKKNLKKNKYNNQEAYTQYLLIDTVYHLLIKRHYARCFFNIQKIQSQKYTKKNFVLSSQIFMLKYEIIWDFISFNKNSNLKCFKNMCENYKKYSKYEHLETGFLKIFEEFKGLITLFYVNKFTFEEYNFYLKNLYDTILYGDKMIKYILTHHQNHSSSYVRKIDFISSFLFSKNLYISDVQQHKFISMKNNENQTEKMIIRHTKNNEFIIEYLSSILAEQLEYKSGELINFDIHKFMPAQFVDYHFSHVVSNLKNNIFLVKNKEIYFVSKSGYAVNFIVNGSILLTLEGEILVYIEVNPLLNQYKKNNVSFITCDEEGEIIALNQQFTENFYIDVNVKNVVQPNLLKNILFISKYNCCSLKSNLVLIKYSFLKLIQNIRALDYSKLWDFSNTIYFKFLENLNKNKYIRMDKVTLNIEITRRCLNKEFYFFDMKLFLEDPKQDQDIFKSIYKVPGLANFVRPNFNTTALQNQGYIRNELSSLNISKNKGLRIYNCQETVATIVNNTNDNPTTKKANEDDKSNVISAKNKIVNVIKKIRSLSFVLKNMGWNINKNDFIIDVDNEKKLKKNYSRLEYEAPKKLRLENTLFRMFLFIIFILGIFLFIGKYSTDIFTQVQIYSLLQLKVVFLRQLNYYVINTIFQINLIKNKFQPETISLKNLNFSTNLNNTIDYHKNILRKRAEEYQENYYEYINEYLKTNDYIMNNVKAFMNENRTFVVLNSDWSTENKVIPIRDFLEAQYRSITKIFEVGNHELFYQNKIFGYKLDEEFFNKPYNFEYPSLGDKSTFFFLENCLRANKDSFDNLKISLETFSDDIFSYFKFRFLLFFIMICVLVIVNFIIEGFLFIDNYNKIFMKYLIIYNILKFYHNELYIKVELLNELFIDFTRLNRRKYAFLADNEELFKKRLFENSSFSIKNFKYQKKNHNNSINDDEFNRPNKYFNNTNFKSVRLFDYYDEFKTKRELAKKTDFTKININENDIDLMMISATNDRQLEVISEVNEKDFKENKGILITPGSSKNITHEEKKKNYQDKINLFKKKKDDKENNISKNLDVLNGNQNLNIKYQLNEKKADTKNTNICSITNNKNSRGNNKNESSNKILSVNATPKSSSVNNSSLASSDIKFNGLIENINKRRMSRNWKLVKGKEKSNKLNKDDNFPNENNISTMNKTDANMLEKHEEENEEKVEEKQILKKAKKYYFGVFLFWIIFLLILILIILNFINASNRFQKIKKFNYYSLKFFERITIYSEAMLVFQISVFKSDSTFVNPSTINSKSLIEKIYDEYSSNESLLLELVNTGDSFLSDLIQLEKELNLKDNFCEFLAKNNMEQISDYSAHCMKMSQNSFSVGFSKALNNFLNYVKTLNIDLFNFFLYNKDIEKTKKMDYLNNFYYKFSFVNLDRIIFDLNEILVKYITLAENKAFSDLEKFNNFLFYFLYFFIIFLGLFTILKSKYLIKDKDKIITYITNIIENSIKFSKYS